MRDQPLNPLISDAMTTLKQVWIIQDMWGDIVQVHSEGSRAKRAADLNNKEDPEDQWSVFPMPIH